MYYFLSCICCVLLYIVCIALYFVNVFSLFASCSGKEEWLLPITKRVNHKSNQKVLSLDNLSVTKRVVLHSIILCI